MCHLGYPAVGKERDEDVGKKTMLPVLDAGILNDLEVELQLLSKKTAFP